MSLPYKRPSEFVDRYQGTVIYYDSNPVYVTGVSPKGDRSVEDRSQDEDWKDKVYLLFQDLPWTQDGNTKQHKYLASDEKFSAVPIHVGYANAFTKIDDYSGKRLRYAQYLTRMPARRVKQGVSGENLYIQTGHSFLDLLYDQEFINMFRGKYKEFKDIKEEITKDRTAFGVTAFAREFALELDTLDQFIIHYKGQKVGYSQNGDMFVLSKSNLWLRETLESRGLQVKEK